MRQRTEASVRQRRVSAELRALRKERGLTCAQVAKAVDCSVTKISRMETGERGLYPDDVSAILGYLQAPAKLREELLTLVRDSGKRNWIQIGGNSPPPGSSSSLSRAKQPPCTTTSRCSSPASSKPATTPEP